MGGIRTCDAHSKGFPNNVIDTNKIEMVKLYVERQFRDPTDAKKKVTGTMFVGDAQDEGAEVCLACFNEFVASRIAPVGGQISFKQVIWASETVQKKDGSGTYQRNTKTIKEIA